MPSIVLARRRTRGSGCGSGPRSASTEVSSARASGARWSTARRRLPVSSRLSVEGAMPAAAATASSESPRSSRSARRRRRMRSSSLAISTRELARSVAVCHGGGMDTDVVVVGGGSAGLQAALTLGRMRFDVVVVDAGRPSNAPADHIGGLLGAHEVAPLDLLATGRAQLAELPSVRLVEGGATRGGPGRTPPLDDGTTLSAPGGAHPT